MDKAYIIKLLETNDKAICRALVVLNERQTLSEQSAQYTINRNGEGFTPADAYMGTSMAQFFIKLRIPSSGSSGDRHRVLTSGVKRETAQTAS